MNDEMNESASMEENKTNMSPMMIVGAVVVIALVGYFVVTSTAQKSSTQSAATDTAMMGDQTSTDEEMMAGDQAEDAKLMANESTMSEASMADGTMMMDGDVTVVSLEGGSFYYKPNVIRVKKGDTVRVDMKSVDMMHDFVIDELNVKMPIAKSGETGTVEFVADTVGEFEFYCSVGQHRANGMVGTLIVEE